MVIFWRLRQNIIRTALCWIVWHNVHSQQHTYMSSSYRSNRLGLSYWDPYAVRRGSWIELYYHNMVEWFWWNSSLILTTSFLQCFDTVGLVIWPVRIIPEMTYYVSLSSGTLNPTHSHKYCVLQCSSIPIVFCDKNWKLWASALGLLLSSSLLMLLKCLMEWVSEIDNINVQWVRSGWVASLVYRTTP